MPSATTKAYVSAGAFAISRVRNLRSHRNLSRVTVLHQRHGARIDKRMKVSKLIGLLVVANLALAGWAYYSLKLRPRTSAIAVVTPEDTKPADPAPQLAAPAAQVMVVTNQITWDQLESEDYKTYIERLRGIGCPEQTIRDLIIADLDKLLAPQFQAIYGRKPDVKYWQSEEEELANNHDHREWARQERELDRKKREIVKELVGADLVRERLKQRGYEDFYERRLGFLPEEKRDSVRAVLEKYDEAEKQIRDRELEDGEPITDAERTRLRQIRVERSQQLTAAMTPEEKQWYELWMSSSANAVRHSMYGMEATEQEFLNVYQLRRAFDDQWNPDEIDWNNDYSVAAYQQARADLETQVRQQLGDDRYAQYKRGGDLDYHHLNAAVSRYGLARNKANEAYEIKQTALQMQAQIRADNSLTPSQQDEAGLAVTAEEEAALRQLLGNAAYRYYRQRSSR